MQVHIYHSDSGQSCIKLESWVFRFIAYVINI